MKNSNQLVIDLFVKLTDIYQCIFSSSYHVCQSKKSIHFSQVLRLNRICSENVFFDYQCNELEVWLKERGYSDKLIR